MAFLVFEAILTRNFDVELTSGRQKSSISNSGGQINVPSELSDVIAIEAGNYHSLALKSDGTIVGWGMNVYEQLIMPEEIYFKNKILENRKKP